MKRIIAIAAAVLALTGCATNGGTVSRIDVNVSSRKLQFVELDESFGAIDPATGNKRGLKTAIAAVRSRRRAKRAAAAA